MIKNILIGLVVAAGLILLIVNLSPSEDKTVQDETAVLSGYNQLLVNVGGESDGDIVVIEDENHKWGRMEKIKFLIVKVPKLTEEEKIAFFSSLENGSRVYKVDYTRFLTEDEVKNLREKKETFTLSRGESAAGVYIATTGEQYPVINKSDIVKR